MVYILCGLQASGKSTYIKEHFPATTRVIDIFELQKYVSVYASYYKMLEMVDLELTNSPEKDLVVENTFFKKKRRQEILDIIKKHNVKSTLIFCTAEDSVIIKRTEARYSDASRDIDYINNNFLLQKSTLEPPEDNEGFDEFFVVNTSEQESSTP